MQWVLIALVIVLAAGGVFFYIRRRQSSDLPLPDIDEPVDYTSMEVAEEPQGLLDRINLLRERFDNMPLPGKIALFASPVLVIVLALVLVIAVPMLKPPPPTPPPKPLPEFAIQKADLVSATGIRVEATTELTTGTSVQFELLEGTGENAPPFLWYAPMEATTEVQTGTVNMRVTKIADAPVPSSDKTYTVRLKATAEDGRDVVVTQPLEVPEQLRAAFYGTAPEQAAGNPPAAQPTQDAGGGAPGPDTSVTETTAVTTPVETAIPPTVTGTLEIPELETPTTAVSPSPLPVETTTALTATESAPVATTPPITGQGWTVTVAHGGNVRQTPVDGEPVGLVDFDEQVTLLQKSSDGVWYQLQTSDGIVGWVHNSLLTIPADVAAQVPVEGTTNPTTPAQTTPAGLPTAEPAATTAAVPTADPAATVAPAVSPTPPLGSADLTAEVFNGGNVRQTPGGDPVLDQINAYEQVELLQKNADGTWYQIRNERDIVGWVHYTLLTIDPEVAARVPVGQ